jgi:hypothetical protein
MASDQKSNYPLYGLNGLGSGLLGQAERLSTEKDPEDSDDRDESDHDLLGSPPRSL